MVEHFQNLIIINVRTYIVMCVHYGNHSVEEKVSNVRCDLIIKKSSLASSKAIQDISRQLYYSGGAILFDGWR